MPMSETHAKAASLPSFTECGIGIHLVTLVDNPDCPECRRKRGLPDLSLVTTWQPISEPPAKSGWYLVVWNPSFDDILPSVHCLKWDAVLQIWPSAGLASSEPNLTHWMDRPLGPDAPTLQASAAKQAADLRAMAEQDSATGSAFSAAWEIVDALPGVWSDERQKLGAQIAKAIDAAKVDVLTHVANWSPES